MSTKEKSKSSRLRQFSDVILLIAILLSFCVGSQWALLTLFPPLNEASAFMLVPVGYIVMGLAFFPAIKLWQILLKVTSNWSFVAAVLMILMVTAGIVYGGRNNGAESNNRTDSGYPDYLQGFPVPKYPNSVMASASAAKPHVRDTVCIATNDSRAKLLQFYKDFLSKNKWQLLHIEENKKTEAIYIEAIDAKREIHYHFAITRVVPSLYQLGKFEVSIVQCPISEMPGGSH